MICHHKLFCKLHCNFLIISWKTSCTCKIFTIRILNLNQILINIFYFPTPTCPYQSLHISPTSAIVLLFIKIHKILFLNTFQKKNFFSLIKIDIIIILTMYLKHKKHFAIKFFINEMLKIVLKSATHQFFFLLSSTI